MSACWTVEETRKLLAVRAEADIISQECSVVLGHVATRLRQSGVIRTETQIKTKLNSLKKQYQQIAEHNDQNDSTKIWAYFALCEAVWGSAQLVKTESLAGNMEEVTASSSSTFCSALPSTSNCPDSGYAEEDKNEICASGDESVVSSGKTRVGLFQCWQCKRKKILSAIQYLYRKHSCMALVGKLYDQWATMSSRICQRGTEQEQMDRVVG